MQIYLLITLLIIAGSIWFFVKSTSKKKKAHLDHFPKLSGSAPLVGHSWRAIQLKGDLLPALMEWGREQPIGYVDLSGPKVLISKPENAKQVLNSPAFRKGPTESSFKTFFGEGLASQFDDAIWKSHRKILNQSFVKGNIIKYKEKINLVFEKKIAELIQESEKHQNKLINFSRFCQETSFQALCTVIFDDMSSDPRLLKALTCLNQSFTYAELERTFQKDYPLLGKWIPTYFTNQIRKAVVEMELVAKEIVGQPKKPELIQQIIDSGLWTETGVYEEIFILLFGGHDTTSLSFQRALLHISKNRTHKDIVTLIESVQKHFDPKNVETAFQSPLLELITSCFKEVMRLDPVTGLTARTCIEATSVGGFDFPEGAETLINIAFIHRDPNIWGADADQFRPSRWLEPSEKVVDYQKYFVAFGGGKRFCIGSHLSETEQIIFLANFLFFFPEFKVDEDISNVHGITNGFDHDLEGSLSLSKMKKNALFDDLVPA